MKTLSEYLSGKTVENLVSYGLSRNEAESFIFDFAKYGIVAFDKWFTAQQQVEICYSYYQVFRA